MEDDACPSDRLIDALWPEAEGDGAASTLKTTLHRLRQILSHEDAVQLGGGQLSLNPACVWVDRWALEEVLDNIGVAATRPPNDQTPDALKRSAQRLLSIYQGRFLEKSDLPCAAKPRDALHRRYVLAIEGVGARFEMMVMRDLAAGCYEHVLKVDPAAERYYQKLESCKEGVQRAPTK